MSDTVTIRPTGARKALLAVLAALCLVGIAALAIPVGAQEAAAAPEYAKNSALCIACHLHEQPAADPKVPAVTDNYKKTKHFTAEGEGDRYQYRGEQHVGCQACHGPGKAHMSSRKPEEIHLPTKAEEGHNGIEGHQEQLSVCARCHAQYEGDFPTDYVYGENLMDKLVLKEPAADTKLEQINEMKDSKHFTDETAPTCVVCHTGHMGYDENLPSQLRKPILELCTECHAAEADLSHSKQTVPEGATCATCHMPGKRHVFKVPAPPAQ